MQKQKAKAVAQRRRLNEIDLGWELNLEIWSFGFWRLSSLILHIYKQAQQGQDGQLVASLCLLNLFLFDLI